MSWLDDLLQHIGIGGGGSPHGGTAPVSALPPGFGQGITAPVGGLGGALPAGFGQGIGALGGAQENPQQVAQGDITKDLGYMQSNPGVLAAGQQVAAGGHHGGGLFHDIGSLASHGLSDILGGLDEGRNAIASLGDVLVNPHSTQGGLSGLSGELHQFSSDMTNPNHIQWGTNIKHALPGALANTPTGHILESVGGIAGDVALDPLTYLGGLGEVSKGLETGGKLLQAARVVGDEGKVAKISDMMGRLSKGGVAALQPEEKNLLGVESGLRVGTRSHNLRVLPSAATDPISARVHEMGMALRARGSASALASKVMPHAAVRASIHDALQRGDFQTAIEKSQTMKASALAPGVAHRFRNEQGGPIRQALSAFKPQEMDSARQALEGQGPLVGDQRVGALKDAVEGVHSALTDRGVQMGHLNDYVPHQVVDAATAAAQPGSKGFSAELQRKLKPGDSLFGHTLENGSIDEINHIMEEEGHGQLFKTDLPSILDTYLHGASNRAGKQAFLNRLGDMGLTSAGDTAMPMDEWGKIAQNGGESINAPQSVKDAMTQLEQEKANTAAHQPGWTGKHIDQLMGMWRKVALAMPGKAIRHMFATPSWGMYIGQVKPGEAGSAVAAWRQYVKGGVDAVKDPEQRDIINKELDLGINHGHSFDHSGGIATEDINTRGSVKAARTLQRYNPAKVYFDKNAEMQARVQDFSRHIMFSDAIKNKGLGDLAAAEKVRNVLGEPGNLTDWEKNYARRVVPFYAFLRTQMPAQVKALAHTPSKFLNVINAEKEASNTQQSPGLVPSYFGGQLAFQSPFHSGKNPLFLAPDLPFTRMNELAAQPVSQLNPLLQAFIEKWSNTNPMTGSQFSPTAKPLPGVLQPIGGLLQKLGFSQPTTQTQTDYGVTTPQGTQVMTPAKLDQLENLNPGINQLIDLFDGASKPGGGTAANISDFIGAVRGYQDGPSQQADVLWERYFALQKMIKDAQNTGSLPPYIPGYHA